MEKNKNNIYLSLMIGAIFFLLLSNIGLYYKLVKLQTTISNLVEPPKGLPEGNQAPGFTLDNLQGEAMSLSQAPDDLLLVFSSTSCPACQKFWPMLVRFHEKNPEIKIWMVSKGSIEANKEMVMSGGFDFPILIWDDEVSKDYKVPGTPYLYYLKDQKILFSGFSDGLEKIGNDR